MHIAGITDWLAQVPTAAASSARPARSSTTRKRPLAEMNSNIVTPEASPAKPNKRLRAHGVVMVDVDQDQADVVQEQLQDSTLAATEDTPRPRRQQIQTGHGHGQLSRLVDISQLQGDGFTSSTPEGAFSNPPSLPPPSDTSSLASDSSRASIPSRRGKRKAPAETGRETSPIRNVASLQVSCFRTHFELLHTVKELRQDVGIRALAGHLEEFRKGRGLVCVDDTAQQDYILPADQDNRENVEHCRSLLTCHLRSSWGRTPDPLDAADLLQVQREAMRMNKAEAAWNADFHSPLFKLAVRHSVFKDHICVENITTASIVPSCLPPLSQDQTLPPKRVDYACCVKLTDSQISTLARRSIHEVNHTSYEALRSRPIAFSIETKTSNSSLEEAKLQVTIWALAHLKKLRILLALVGNPNAVLPPLPLVIAHACCWEVYFLESGPEDAALRGPVLMGHSHTPEGFYAVVAGLQRLIAWAKLEYMPWWEREILARLEP